MTKLTTIIGLLALLLLPLDASAFLLAPGQCSDPETFESIDDDATMASLAEAVESDWFADVEDCTSDDPTDPSSNACFEGAEYPVSTLPALIAQGQAERLVAAMVNDAVEKIAQADTPLVPSPNEASMEDPVLPGQPLLAERAIPMPRPEPNYCSVFPAECESAPRIPTLNLDVSVPSAHPAGAEFVVEPALDAESRRGPPALGVGPSTGVRTELERPPEIA